MDKDLEKKQEHMVDVVEAYGGDDNCGNSSDDYHCKKDCIVAYNALFSAVH